MCSNKLVCFPAAGGKPKARIGRLIPRPTISSWLINYGFGGSEITTESNTSFPVFPTALALGQRMKITCGSLSLTEVAVGIQSGLLMTYSFELSGHAAISLTAVKATSSFSLSEYLRNLLA
jgi:hypothetical protein